MKIEKLSENQIRCTLNKSDLAARQLKISELAYGSEKAKKLFQDMMQQASYEFGFEAEDIPLMIEAIPVSADCIVLIVTKVDDPEELDTRFSKFSPSDPDDDYEDYDYPYEDYDSMETIDASAAHALPSANDELNESDTDADSIEDDVLNIFSKLNDYLNKGSVQKAPELSLYLRQINRNRLPIHKKTPLSSAAFLLKIWMPSVRPQKPFFRYTMTRVIYLSIPTGATMYFWKRPAVLLWTLTRPATFFPNTAKKNIFRTAAFYFSRNTWIPL